VDRREVVVLASIVLRSQHGRLVSARVSASLRKRRAFWAHATGPQVKRRAGLTGSCCRGAGHEEEEKKGSKGLPRQDILSAFIRFCPGTAYTSCPITRGELWSQPRSSYANPPTRTTLLRIVLFVATLQLQCRMCAIASQGFSTLSFFRAGNPE
jgi:hypothetical protein